MMDEWLAWRAHFRVFTANKKMGLKWMTMKRKGETMNDEQTSFQLSSEEEEVLSFHLFHLDQSEKYSIFEESLEGIQGNKGDGAPCIDKVSQLPS